VRSAGRLSSDRVAGEHRVRVPFAHSLSGPLLAAIEVILGRGVPGWFASGTGFRFAVRGGYAIFHP